ncbi:hypothetical protein [Alkalilacustris brevis]|nr:hypothetical protein [Alkalilacustris brevis]
MTGDIGANFPEAAQGRSPSAFVGLFLHFANPCRYTAFTQLADKILIMM